MSFELQSRKFYSQKSLWLRKRRNEWVPPFSFFDAIQVICWK